MATDHQQEITLKVFVNKAKNCVAFVESDLDFVDVLLSFLTLPVGTVVRLLNKQSSLGCFDKLYQSVEQLDEKYLVTAGCRSMLTKPVNSSGVKCQKLRINIDKMGELYTCLPYCCCHRSFSYYSGLKCQCGGDINKAVTHDINQDHVDYQEFHGVFIKGDKFGVTDALSIASIEDAMSSSDEWGDGDWSNLEQRVLKIERAQVLDILKQSLISGTPLTDVLLHDGVGITPKCSVPSVEKTVASKAFDKEKQTYSIKLALTRSKVLYAVASRDLVDVIFSILTFPLGTLKKHLGSRFRIGCLNNLYGSVERLASLGYVVSGCEERLLNPKLAPYFNSKCQVIGVEEEKQDVYYACSFRCKLSATRYHCTSHPFTGYQTAEQANLIDPKRQHPTRSDSPCGSYCKELLYMVSDELVVTPLCLTEAFLLRKEFSESVKMVELGIGEEEALDLLSAASSSKTALTVAFFARANAVVNGGKR
ncbi:hypothetical protein ZIOFF_056264 [Zingiber officinale]|uniref:DUF674 family protein n=1 Tax=Zingiber officinale TaxID=94328 RepID=A0A8J5FLW2_ZINOF|nr:hypothetical protein ZIOFF_056264 [Zingiber officinale]